VQFLGHTEAKPAVRTSYKHTQSEAKV
jgi:hypothetical protein